MHRPRPSMLISIPLSLSSVAGELGSLVGIEYFRLPKLKSHFQRLQTECRIQGRGCLPSKDIAAPPVRHGNQIHESSGKRNVGYIGSPNLILSIYTDVPQQVRINLAQMGLRIDGLQAHFPHQPLNMLPVDRMFVSSQMSSHLPGTVKRRLVETVLNQVLEAQVTETLGAGRHERTEERVGCRARTLYTRAGPVSLLVPQRGTAVSRPTSSSAASAANKPSCWR